MLKTGLVRLLANLTVHSRYTMGLGMIALRSVKHSV